MVLPRLRPDPHDAQAALVRDVRSLEPHERFEPLRAADPATPDVQLELARTALDRGDAGVVDAATNTLLHEDPWEWRAVWIQGLAALARRDTAAAQAAFNAVYGQVPGELAPKLALAFACEVSGEAAIAESLYAVCARTDSNYTPVGAFGMARIRRAEGGIPAAVEALDLIPVTSRAYALARHQRGQLLADSGQGLPALAEALRSVDGVPLDASDKAGLTVQVLENALTWVTSPQGGPNPGITLAGHPASVSGVRQGLEAAYRQLAEVTPDPAARTALVDQANAVRPWSVL